MKGDILIIEEHHRQAARECTQFLKPSLDSEDKAVIISVAGESGAGKSEVAASLAEEMASEDIPALVFQQDDYFVYPPLSNAKMREKDLKHVGPGEVRLDEIDRELELIRAGEKKIKKPLVIFSEDQITTEEIDVSGYRVFIIEGTYTTLLDNIDYRIFIDRNVEDTREARLRRNREKQDDYLEKILSIEHRIISAHRDLADIIITKDFHAVRKEDYDT